MLLGFQLKVNQNVTSLKKICTCIHKNCLILSNLFSCPKFWDSFLTSAILPAQVPPPSPRTKAGIDRWGWGGGGGEGRGQPEGKMKNVPPTYPSTTLARMLYNFYHIVRNELLFIVEYMETNNIILNNIISDILWNLPHFQAQCHEIFVLPFVIISDSADPNPPGTFLGQRWVKLDQLGLTKAWTEGRKSRDAVYL